MLLSKNKTREERRMERREKRERDREKRETERIKLKERHSKHRKTGLVSEKKIPVRQIFQSDGKVFSYFGFFSF